MQEDNPWRNARTNKTMGPELNSVHTGETEALLLLSPHHPCPPKDHWEEVSSCANIQVRFKCKHVVCTS